MFNCWLKQNKKSFIFLPLTTNLPVPPLLSEVQLESQLCERYVNQFHSVNISLATSALHVLCTCLSETWITNCTHMAGILPIPKPSEQHLGLHTNDWRLLIHFLMQPGFNVLPINPIRTINNSAFCGFLPRLGRGRGGGQRSVAGAEPPPR